MKTNTKFNFEGDNLVYVVTALPGGADGLDSSNRGGPVWAFLTEDEAKKKTGVDTRYLIKPTVMNAPEIRRGLRKKLTVQERLYLKVLGVDLTR
jgi:hypothetical protein